MKEIKLTRGYIALVDNDDFKYLNQWRWHTAKIGNIFYARRSVYIPNNRKVIKIHMHREIMLPPYDKFIDHIDHNGLNNQRANLRICTLTQNMINRDTPNKTGFRGLSCNSKGYSASIRVNRIRIYLGTYKTKEEAARVYDKAAIKYFGEFAQLNYKNEMI